MKDTTKTFFHLPMKSDCSSCCGLCCTALFFSKIDGFPYNKEAGVPCKHMRKDFLCDIHANLAQKGCKGCIGYDCFGAGQHVTSTIYQGQSWASLSDKKQEQFDVFMVVFQLYQMRYYLSEALLLCTSPGIQQEIEVLMEHNVLLCGQTPEQILAFDIEPYHQSVNFILKQIIQRSIYKKSPPAMMGKSFLRKCFDYVDFSFQLLLATNMQGCSFHEAIFLGADTRDANFTTADLSKARFLTQQQINSAKGSRQTKLPAHLDYPVTWI